MGVGEDDKLSSSPISESFRFLEVWTVAGEVILEWVSWGMGERSPENGKRFAGREL